DLATGEVWRGEEKTILEPRVAELLGVLVRHAGKVVSKEQLLQAVWADAFVSDDVLWRGISELRRVFADDPQAPRVIETLARRGYRLVATVELDNSSELSETSEPDLDHRTSRTLLSIRRRSLWIGVSGLMLLILFAAGRRESVALGEEKGRDLVRDMGEAAALRAAGIEASWETGWSAAGLDAGSRANEHRQDRPRALTYMADSMLARGRMSTATVLYRQVLQDDAQSPAATERIADVRLLQQSMARDPLETHEAAQVSVFDAEASTRLAQAYRLLEESGEARQRLLRTLAARPGYEPALIELIRLELSQGSLPRARLRVEQALAIDASSPNLLTLAAELELLAGDADKALRYLDRACVARLAGSTEVANGSAQQQENSPAPFLCWLP
ncbi:MAG: winged helix-turn-helix domain-containing protein, partial [Acidobacteriota bacterium]